ncbi:calcitonin gene-related peptide-receptor component protein, isoform CRA_d [Mus musculus]|nr:calcitonin gene-related peptide-receptor component protein, isoform CRA_d [Mus musculus]
MEVKDANAALLSNYEVFQLLTDLKEQRKESGKNKHSAGQQNLNAITYETLKYISKTPCRNQSPAIVQEFLTAMKSHKLTKLQSIIEVDQDKEGKHSPEAEAVLLSGLFTDFCSTSRLVQSQQEPPPACLRNKLLNSCFFQRGVCLHAAMRPAMMIMD